MSTAGSVETHLNLATASVLMFLRTVANAGTRKSINQSINFYAQKFQNKSVEVKTQKGFQFHFPLTQNNIMTLAKSTHFLVGSLQFSTNTIGPHDMKCNTPNCNTTSLPLASTFDES